MTNYLNGQCMFNIAPILAQQIHSSDFNDVSAVLSREIEMHEIWVREYQNSKIDFIEEIYTKFQTLITHHFRAGVTVGSKDFEMRVVPDRPVDARVRPQHLRGHRQQIA